MGKELEIPADSKKSADGIETILMVEDQEELRVVSRKVLELHGYVVLEASDGQSAIEKCKSHDGPIHLMITDIVMPRMGGVKLAPRVNLMRPNMKILYVTGYPEGPYSQRNLPEGIHHFLEKPYTPGTLVKKIKEILEK